MRSSRRRMRMFRMRMRMIMVDRYTILKLAKQTISYISQPDTCLMFSSSLELLATKHVYSYTKCTYNYEHVGSWQLCQLA